MTDQGQKEEKVVPPGVRLVVTDELGTIKGVEARGLRDWDGCKVACRWGEPNRQNGISAACVSSREGITDTGSAMMAVSRGESGYEVIHPVTGHLLGKIGKSPGKRNKVTGVSILWNGSFLASRDRGVLSSTVGGLLRLHAPPAGVDEGSAWEELCSWDIAQACDCLAVHANTGLAAVGAQGCELAVWDIAAQKRTFLAKGAKKDFLGLQDKPWVTTVAWLPGEDSRKVSSALARATAPPVCSPLPAMSTAQGLPLLIPAGTTPGKVVVGTGSSKIRLYDLSSSMRRPAMEASFDVQTRVTCVAPTRDGSSVWASNGLGVVQQWDLAANRMGGVLKGHGGAVRSIALHPEEDLVASVGLDRWLRVHDGATRKQLVKVYLKQQLTSVAWCPCDPPTPETHAAPEAVRMKRSSSKEGSSKGKKKRLVALP